MLPIQALAPHLPKMPICTTLWINSGVWFTEPPEIRRMVWATHHPTVRKKTTICRRISTISTLTPRRISCTIWTAVRSGFLLTLPRCKYSEGWYIACQRSLQSVPENDHLEHRVERIAATPHLERDPCRVQGQIQSRMMLSDSHFHTQAFIKDTPRGNLFIVHYHRGIMVLIYSYTIGNVALVVQRTTPFNLKHSHEAMG